MACLFNVALNCITVFDTDTIKDRNDAMVKSIAEQNQKVERESDNLVKAIDERGKKIESKEEDEKFQKASSKIDDLMKNAENAVEQKGWYGRPI